jgi:hypothetical protein
MRAFSNNTENLYDPKRRKHKISGQTYTLAVISINQLGE